uniref:Mannose-P-dolichol utilization defect 1 protein homolog n=1 Tax=Gongylonema pulchrum TaxID=637853 RepID=A0A183DZZ2_9BILA
LFVGIQVAIIVVQILWFSARRAHAAVFVAFCWTLACAVTGDYIPFSVLACLQAITIPVIIAAKVLQIHANYRQKSTGQLSLISVSLQFSGCLARIFTSMKETGDRLVIINYVIAALLNGVIFAQFFLYWKSTEKKKLA